jgi:acyl-CoA dehydrogenase
VEAAVNFDESEEQSLLRETVQSFVAAECPRELVRRYEAEGRFPRELWTKLAGLGIAAIALPESRGGTESGTVEQAIVAEELAQGALALAVAFVNTACLGASVLAAAAQPELRDRLLPEVARGDLILTFAWTEPSGGSDVLSMTTVAESVEDGRAFVVDGAKTFITLAREASHVFTVLRTDPPAERRSDGLSCLLIETAAAGVEISHIEKVGQRSAPFYDVRFAGVRVGAGNLIGDRGDAWRRLAPRLGSERVLFAALCLGLARRAFADALAYSLERPAFGRPIGGFQALQHRLVDMRAMIDSARLLTYRAAWLEASGRSAAAEATQAFLVASTAADRVTDGGMQILGAAGYTTDFDMERHWRDARAFRVSPVTREVAKNTLARSLGLPRSY